MKIFVWENVSKVSNSYHSDGGLVIFAETIERAYELAKEHEVEFDAKYDELIPARVSEVCDEIQKEEVFIFPNAGCC